MAQTLTVTLKKWRTDWGVPQVDSLVRKGDTRTVYRVTGVRQVRAAGEPPGHLARVEVALERIRAEDVTATVAIFPTQPQPPRREAPAPVVVVEKPPPVVVTPAKPSKPGRKRKNRGNKPFPPTRLGDPPASQRLPVKDADGVVIRHALLEAVDWRDPEDTNRSSRRPRMVRGYASTDAIAKLRKQNDAITEDHVLACDLFRETWERWSRSASVAMVNWMRAGSRTGQFRDGTDDRTLKALRAVRNLRAYFHDNAWSCLMEVVLDRGYVSYWGDSIGLPGRTYKVGYFIAVLDQLAKYYKDEIDERRTQMVRETPS